MCQIWINYSKYLYNLYITQIYLVFIVDQPNVEKNDMNMMELPDESEITDNPFISSKTVSVGQYSFIDYRQKYVKVAPPPVYFTDD